MLQNKSGKVIGPLIALIALLVAGVLATAFYFSSSSIHELLTENKALNSAIANLSAEEQIGYATLISQESDTTGELQSTIRLVQTAAGNPKERVAEQLFTIQGDIIHFDALIVKFDPEYVKQGKGRALYLWRRIYGENQQPSQGQLIEIPDSAPERYYAISKTLRIAQRDIFWEAIWQLANQPDHLSVYGITAVFGNAIYCRMQPNKVYLFKINSSGQIYPEVLNTY
ncbi:MAG: hypothetical protein ACI81V_000523 [Lentimonas sp.]|jgi:hypothetical protein